MGGSNCRESRRPSASSFGWRTINIGPPSPRFCATRRRRKSAAWRRSDSPFWRKKSLPPEEAFELLIEARDELEQAANSSANNPRLKAGLASCYDSLGELYAKTGRPTLARENCERAKQIWSQLAQEEPTLASYRAMVENQFSVSRLDLDEGGPEHELSRLTAGANEAFVSRSRRLLPAQPETAL